MNANTEERVYHFDFVKWVFVIALVVVGIVGNSHYSAESILYRALALLALSAVAVLIGYQTAKGAALADVIRGAFIELRKVVWPSRQETNQTTLIVVAVVIVTSIILWLLDTVLGFFVSKLIG
jgi:preprotein translocase subunit SecE